MISSELNKGSWKFFIKLKPDSKIVKNCGPKVVIHSYTRFDLCC